MEGKGERLGNLGEGKANGWEWRDVEGEEGDGEGEEEREGS